VIQVGRYGLGSPLGVRRTRFPAVPKAAFSFRRWRYGPQSTVVVLVSFSVHGLATSPAGNGPDFFPWISNRIRWTDPDHPSPLLGFEGLRT
jgi:hypothetical protein